MKTIPQETVDAMWEKFPEADEQQSRAMAARMQREQPYVMIYLYAMDENLFEEAERGRLMELGAFVCEVMCEGRRLRQVTDRDIEKHEKRNFKMLEGLEAGSEMQMADAVRSFERDYNQAPLLGAVLEALMAGHEDAPELAPENIGLAMMYLKTVIDCLDQ